MCVSFANERKTQVGWVVTIGSRMQRKTNANNTPKRSPYHVPNSNEMTMKSPCLETSEKYSGDGCA